MEPEKIVRRYLAGSGEIRVVDADIVSGQGPADDFDSEFIAPVEVTIDVSGMALARLLGVQQRVLVAFLEDLETKKAINYLYNGGTKASVILDATKATVKRVVNNFAYDEFERTAKVIKMDFSDTAEYWDADIEPQKQNIRYTIELDVIAEWG
jgi:hypothetical protein